MKKIILFVLSVVTVCSLVAQKVQFYDGDGQTIAADTMMLEVPTADNKLYFKLKNTTTSNVNAIMKGSLNNDFKGNEYGFCILGSCITAPNTTGTFTIAPEEFSTEDTYVAFYANDDGEDGIFYGQIDILDNSTLLSLGSRIIQFKRGDVGIKNTAQKTDLKVDLFPNPASDQIKICYDLSKVSSKNNTLIIRNLVGVVVKTIPLPKGEKEIIQPVTDLNNGVYFYSLITDGIVQSTKKLIIRK